MTLIDECIIYNKSLKDDLKNYSVTDTQIQYSDNSNKDYTTKISVLEGLFPGDSASYSGAWFPVFISNDDNIDNKVLSSRGSLLNSNASLKSGRMGIEDFVSFEANFENWTVEPTATNMVADWVLNRPSTPFYIKDGIMCWAQEITTPTNRMIREYPNESRLKSDSSNDTLVKYQENKLFNTTKDSSVFSAGSFSFGESSGTIIVGGTGVGGPYYKPATLNIIENRSNNTIIDNSKTLFKNNKYILWIADGDYFSYYEDPAENSNTNLASKSYISPSLWSKYTQIYHILTLREPKDIGSSGSPRGKNLNRARKLKKLAHILATSPYVTDECINALDHSSIRILVTSFLDSVATQSPIDTIKEIVKVLHINLRLLQKIPIYNTTNTLTNNIITNSRELVTKIIDKYGLRLKITTDTTLQYKSYLPHGDSVNIIQAYQTLCNKTYNSRSISNNQKISLDKISLTSSLSDTSTSLSLQVEANPITKIPLYDIAIENPGEIKLNINWRTDRDTAAAGSRDGWSDNVYLATKFGFGEPGKLMETQIELVSIAGLENNTALSDKAAFQSIVSCFWEKIKGPCLKFDDENKSSIAVGSDPTDYMYSRFDTSTYIEPSVYVYAMGEYEIQCTFVTSYGTFIKRKKFYVVDGIQQFPGQPPNVNFGKYYSEGTWITPVSVNTESLNYIRANSDKLAVRICSFKNIALHKHCLFWPIETDHMIEKVFSGTNVKDTLRQKYRFWFGLQNPADFAPKNSDSTLKIKYIPQDTIFKIDTIILQNLRNTKDSCKTCLSMYRPTFEASPSLSTSANLKTIVEVYNRTNKEPDELTLQEYKKTSATAIAVKTNIPKTFPYPQISLDFAPPLLSYGGYNDSLVSQIGTYISGHPSPGTVLPSVMGHPLNYKTDNDTSTYKACYQTPISATGYIDFTKGLFHPSSGFVLNTGTSIPNNLQNKTSVLKFNPGARDTFNFIGPGLFRITNTYAGAGTGLYVSPIVYQSAINLAISPLIQPAPACISPGLTQNQADTLNKTHKQLLDQYINGKTYGITDKAPYKGSYHGYRSLEGGNVKLGELGATSSATPVNDEFGFSSSEYFCATENGDSDVSTFNYKFATNGPNYSIQNSETQLKIPGSTIQDIEVRLNFLNYVNPKNLVVWLDINPSAKEKKRLAGTEGRPPCPLAIATSQFMDQTIPVGAYGRRDIYETRCSPISGTISGAPLDPYITSLTYMNSTAAASEPLRLFLLNQEYIQNNKYNLSMKFTDHASKYNTLFDENKINPNGININQTIFQDGQEILPSISATGFNDIDYVTCKNIIRKNKLNITNNTFSKYKNLSLFVYPAPDDDLTMPNMLSDGFDSSTTFTLNVMVVDEPDEMIPYDTVVNNPFITNFDTSENKKTSTQIYNSLCNWELILHTNKYEKYTASMSNDLSSYGTSDVLGLIDYKSVAPKLPGYNFISMSPSGSSYYSYFDDVPNALSLIPNVNINAPYIYINDTSVCQSANPALIGTSTILQPPRFPIESILMILVSLAGGAATGTLVGLNVLTTAGFNLAYQGLFDYFYALREAREREGRVREVYQPKYEHYPFGSPEKVLLNVSKDGGIWYKLEASIFKYKNTPALRGNQYKFIRLKRGNIPLFSEFIFETVYSITQLIDDSFLEVPQEVPNNSITPTPSPTPITTPPAALDRLNSNIGRVSQLNHMLSYNKSIFGSDLLTKITNKKMIIIKGKLAYYLLHIGDIVPHYKSAERNATPVAADVVTIVNKGLILKNNIEYTVLEIDKDISSYDALSCNSDTVVVFSNNKNPLNDDDPFGAWGLEKSPISSSEPPNKYKSATGLGSYGDGSPFVKKNILTYKLQHNKLYSIYEIFNNHVNDKVKKTSINLILSDGTIKTISSSNGFYGYGYSARDTRELFIEKSSQIIADKGYAENQRTIDYILSKLQYNTAETNNDNFAFMFLKCPEFKDNTNFQTTSTAIDEEGQNVTVTTDNAFGDIVIPEDLVKKQIIEKLSSTTVDSLNARINKIESKTINSTLEDAVGNPTQTDTIIGAGSIYYVSKHLEELLDDPIDCYKKSTFNTDGTYTATSTACPKKKTRKALQDLYTERSTLLQILSINKSLSDNVLPLQSFSLSGVDSNGAYPVHAKLVDINQNLYWINIDPKQSCTIAEEMCPKVLKSVMYTCSPITNTTVFVHADNNICPDFLSRAEHSISDGGEIDVKITSPSYTSYRGYQYTIPSGTVEKQKTDLKTKYPNIYSWSKFTKNRSFRINTDNGITDVYGGVVDLLVRVEEEYALGLPEHLTNPNFTIPSTNDGSADVTQLTAFGGCSPAGASSPGGSGLLSFNNVRSPLTRVYNIFNLDSINTLKVQFRKIPRQIRGVDLSNTVYRYGRAGLYRQTSPGNPPSPSELDIISGEGSLNNNFYAWNCIERDSSTKKAKLTTLPPFLKIQNEMTYRAFYGSADGIENKEDILQSLYPYELIPYEYFTSGNFPNT